MKATTRVRYLTSGELRYQWTENGVLAHCRHAQALDHLAGSSRTLDAGLAAGMWESLML